MRPCCVSVVSFFWHTIVGPSFSYTCGLITKAQADLASIASHPSQSSSSNLQVCSSGILISRHYTPCHFLAVALACMSACLIGSGTLCSKHCFTIPQAVCSEILCPTDTYTGRRLSKSCFRLCLAICHHYRANPAREHPQLSYGPLLCAQSSSHNSGADAWQHPPCKGPLPAPAAMHCQSALGAGCHCHPPSHTQACWAAWSAA